MILLALAFPLAGITADEPLGSDSPRPVDSIGPDNSPLPSDFGSPSAAAACVPPGPPETPRIGSPEIFGYLPYWDLDATIDYGAITTVAYFGLQARSDGTL